MNRIEKLNVYIDERLVGTLAIYKRSLCTFEYSDEWLENGFSISPFSLPLEKRVFIPKPDPFEGLYGAFADSLPDGWGRLLVDRLLVKNRIDPHTYGNLDRLAIVGDSGMGALTYRPEIRFTDTSSKLSLDEISKECARILDTEYTDKLDDLFAMGSSSGGARPKIFTTIDGEDWIIKFPSKEDSLSIGKQEYDYSRCAAMCGIEMSECRLFDSKKCSGYFGTKRFDRIRKKDGTRIKIHMLSVSALLETSHRIPNLDYDLLMRLTLELTKDMCECEKLFKLMCFNVFAHNRDDHSKNFTYMYDEENSRWYLSPAYDLTYSHSIGGEHATCVHGNGVNPGLDDIMAVARGIGLDSEKSKRIALDIRDCVYENLGEYMNRGK